MRSGACGMWRNAFFGLTPAPAALYSERRPDSKPSGGAGAFALNARILEDASC